MSQKPKNSSQARRTDQGEEIAVEEAPVVDDVAARRAAHAAALKAKQPRAAQMRKMMKKRMETSKVYNDTNYGTRSCLWNVHGSVYEVPQHVGKVPNAFTLFKTVCCQNMMDSSRAARRWRLEKEAGREQVWQDRVEELKEEQQAQIDMGAVVLEDE